VNNLTKNLVLWLVIAMVLMAVFNNFSAKDDRGGREIDYSTFLNQVRDGRVERVTIDGAAIYGQRYNGDRFVSYSPGDPELVNDLVNAGVSIKAKKEEGTSLLMTIFISLDFLHAPDARRRWPWCHEFWQESCAATD